MIRQLLKSTASSTNVRAQPNTTSDIIALIPRAGIVGYVGQVVDGKWANVLIGNTLGFVHSDFVTFAEAPEADGFIQIPEINLPDAQQRLWLADVLRAIATSVEKG